MMLNKMPLALLLSVALMGCAQTPFYESRHGDQVASLRVVSDVQHGSTFVTTSSGLDCKKDPNGARLGGFSPMLHGDFFLESNGLNHKLSLPGAEGLAYNMYSEWKVDAARPLFLRATAVVSGSGYVVGTTYVANNGEINAVAGFTPRTGEVYEVVYGFDGARPKLRLYEVAKQGDGRTVKTQLPFDLGSLDC